jgi:phage shock protein C
MALSSGGYSQQSVKLTSNPTHFSMIIIEIARSFSIGMRAALYRSWLERSGRGNAIKGIKNVHDFQLDPQCRHRSCWRIHHCASVRLGRDVPADRLNKLQAKEPQMNGRFLINRRDAKVMGVAACLADYTGIDPLLIRLAFIAATLITGPVMIVLYLLTGWLAPQH